MQFFYSRFEFSLGRKPKGGAVEIALVPSADTNS
jgi:hypothetical protein